MRPSWKPRLAAAVALAALLSATMVAECLHAALHEAGGQTAAGPAEGCASPGSVHVNHECPVCAFHAFFHAKAPEAGLYLCARTVVTVSCALPPDAVVEPAEQRISDARAPPA